MREFHPKGGFAMKLTQTVAVVACIAAALVGNASAAPIIEVYASSAPNAFGSPSWTEYVSNALYALRERGFEPRRQPRLQSGRLRTARADIHAGRRDGDQLQELARRGEPGGAVRERTGNRLHFGLHIVGNDVQFRMQDIFFEIISSDIGNDSGYGGQGPSAMPAASATSTARPGDTGSTTATTG